METLQLLGTAMGLGAVAGINLYATVFAVGFGVATGMIHLSPHLQGLAVLGHPLVLIVAGTLYVVEFFADKIPWVDSAWDALHTFIRPLGAACLGAAALGSVDPALEVAAFLLAGGVALATHTTKAGVRLVTNGSPEPFSNIFLSLAEDVVAVAGVWLALAHPVLAGVLAASFAGAFALVAPRLFRLLRAQILALAALARVWSGREAPPDDVFDAVPPGHAQLLPPGFGVPGDFAVRCLGGRAVGAPAWTMGYLCLAGGRLVFLARRGFGVREYTVDVAHVDEVRTRSGFLFDRLSLRSGGHIIEVFFFRDRRRTLDAVARRLRTVRAVELATPVA
jgi:hypothetical protein